MPISMRPEFTVRAMIASDLPAVLALERSAHAHPWSAEQFLRELANPAARIALLETGGVVAGFLCWWMVAGDAEIHNVVTAHSYRRRGVARHLVEHALAEASDAGACRILLEVRIGNAGAIALYRSFGFSDSGLRRRYYADGEDALLMERNLGRLPEQES